MVALLPLAPVAGKLALAAGKGALVRAVTRSFASGAAFQAGAELVAQIAEWARSIDGNWDSEGETPAGGAPPTDGCWKVEGGAGIYEERESSSLPFAPPVGAICNVTSCIADIVEFNEASQQLIVRLTRTYLDGSSDTTQIGRSRDWQWRINPSCGTGVCSTDPYPGTGSQEGPIDLGPLQSGNCNINVTFMGFLGREDGRGNIEPVFYLEPATGLRASGGVIVGECNFQPTVMVGGGGDGGEPPRTYPNPDFPRGDDDWWRNLAAGLAGGLAAGVLNALLENLFTAQGPASFTLTAPCNKDDEGNPETYTVEFPAESYAERMISWQIAGADLLQQHLNWKTPICKDVPQLEGDFRTISFRSDETSPYGKSRLRKRLRYRSTSGFGLSEVVNHWASFTFEAGPVCVKHRGSSWGTVAVWAATADEGKRVIRHAAGEAGIDPDQVGRWTVGGSSSPRFGVSGTMRVDTTGGYYWITARDGSDSRPIVAKT